MAPACLLGVCSLLCAWSVVTGHPCRLDHQVGGPRGLRRGQQRGAGRGTPLPVLPAQPVVVAPCACGAAGPGRQLLLCTAAEMTSHGNPREQAELTGRCAVPVASSHRGGSPAPGSWLPRSQPCSTPAPILGPNASRCPAHSREHGRAGKALSKPWHFGLWGSLGCSHNAAAHKGCMASSSEAHPRGAPSPSLPSPVHGDAVTEARVRATMGSGSPSAWRGAGNITNPSHRDKRHGCSSAAPGRSWEEAGKVAVTGGWHRAVLSTELSETPSKGLHCFLQPPRAQPCLSVRQDLCSAPVARPHYNPVLGSPGLKVHICSSGERGRQGLVGDSGEQEDERRGDQAGGKETERLASWKAARPRNLGLQTAASFQHGISARGAQTWHGAGARACPTKLKLLTCSLAASVWAASPLPHKAQAGITCAGDRSPKPE